MCSHFKILTAQNFLPTLSPRLLEPLSRRPEEPRVPPVVRHHVPLRFSSPLSSWTRRRSDGVWSHPQNGPLATKGGSEESGSSSSSIDLEDEGDGEGDVRGKVLGESPLRFAGDGSLNDESPTGDGLVQMTFRNIPSNHRSASSGKPAIAPRFSSEEVITDDHCEGKGSNTKQSAHRHIFERSTDEQKETVNDPVTSKTGEVKNNAFQTPEILSEEIHKRQHEPDQCFEGNLRGDLLTKQDFLVDNSISLREEVKLQTEGKFPSPTSAGQLSEARKDSGKMASSKERRMQTACSQRSNTQTNSKTCHTQDKSFSNKTKSGLRYSSSESKQNKARKSKSPGVHCEISSPHPREKAFDKPSRLNSKLGSRVQQLPALKELKDSQLLKRPSLDGTTRSKSAVDFVTYNDMFQQMQNGNEGPAIYEMFAGPIYDNLRASCSWDRAQDRKAQCAKAMCRPLKRKSRVAPQEKTVVLANERPKQSSTKQKNNLTPASSNKNQKIRSIAKQDVHEEAESAVPKDADNCLVQEEGQDQMLSTIEEINTLKSDTRTLNIATDSSQKTPLPDPMFNQNPEQSNSHTWEPASGSSPTVVSPVYQRFLDDVGDGPLTDDLLQCLAEELISLDKSEKDLSTGPSELFESTQEKSDTENEATSGKKENPQVKSFHGIRP